MRLVFPEAAELERQIIGGVLYLLLAAALLGVAYWGGRRRGRRFDGFFLFAGLTVLAVGIAASGYRYETAIDLERHRVQTYEGFFFFGQHREYDLSQFARIEVQRSTSPGQRFSRLPHRVYEPTVEVHYDVRLVGEAADVSVDFTGVAEKADAWAQELGAALKLPVSRRDIANDDDIADDLPPGLVWALTLLGLATFGGWIGFNLYRALKSETK